MQHRGDRRMGFLGQYRVAFPMRGGGWGLGSGLVPWVGCGSHGEVDILGGGRMARPKKKNGVRASSLGAGLWGSWARFSTGFS